PPHTPHSFPTRRSSDLEYRRQALLQGDDVAVEAKAGHDVDVRGDILRPGVDVEEGDHAAHDDVLGVLVSQEIELGEYRAHVRQADRKSTRLNSSHRTIS